MSNPILSLPYVTLVVTREQADAIGYALGTARREIGTPASTTDKDILRNVSAVRDLLETAPYRPEFLDTVAAFIAGYPGLSTLDAVISFCVKEGIPTSEARGLIAALIATGTKA